MHDILKNVRFSIKPTKLNGENKVELARTLPIHPLTYQELPYDPEYSHYAGRLTTEKLSNATPDQMYWKTRKEIILRHTGEYPYEISGPDSLKFLEKIFPRNISKIKVGRCSYQFACYHDGGMITDGILLRLEENKFWVLAGAGNGMIDINWLRVNAPNDGSVQIIDWTSALAGIGLWGPNSRSVLEKLCDDDDISNEAFPFFSIKRISISNIPCVAVRISYIGELGWEIYTPTEYGLTLWDELRNTSREFNMICSGAGAFESLRLEKGYRSLGSDIHTNTNPYESGLGFTVKLKKDTDFIGILRLYFL